MSGIFSTIADWTGLGRSPVQLNLRADPTPAAKAEAAPMAPQSAPTPRRWPRPTFQASNQARALTPKRLHSILQRAEQGQPADFIELVREIEDRDGHLTSVLGTRKRQVANLGWRLEPATDRARDRRVAQKVQALVDRIDNLEDGLLDLLDAIPKGYAVVDCDWQTGSEFWVRSLDYRPQEWFVPDEADPSSFRVLSAAEPMRGEALVPFRHVVHIAKAKSGWPTQAALGRVLAWMWLFKGYASKDWVSFLERFGAPSVVGHYPSTALDADLDDIYTHLQRLRGDSTALIPDDVSIDYMEPAGKGVSGDLYEKFVVFANREISKAVLGQTLTTEESARGTQALGNVHNEVRQDIVISDAKQLARTLTRGLIEPLTRYNFGPNVGVPRWVFDTEPPSDEAAEAAAREARGRVFQLAVNMGVPVAAAQVREEMGLREVADGEEVLEAVQASPGPFGMKGKITRIHKAGGRCSCGHHHALRDDGDEPAVPAVWAEVRDRVESERDDLRATWAWWMLDLSADLAAAIEDRRILAKDILMAGPGDDEVVELEELLRRLDAELARAVEETGLPMVEQYAEALTEAGDQADQAGDRQESDDAAEVGTDEDAEERRRARRQKAREAGQHAALRAIAQVRATAETVIREQSAASSRDIADAIVQTAQRLASAPQMTDEVFDQLVTISWQQGRQAAQQRQLDRKPYFMYHSALKETSRETHKAMHGKVWAGDHPVWQAWMPPNGWGCLCWVTAHSAAQVQANGWKVLDEPPRNLVNGKPLVPDGGWQRDPRRLEHEYDWTPFPRDWRDAVGVEA